MRVANRLRFAGVLLLLAIIILGGYFLFSQIGSHLEGETPPPQGEHTPAPTPEPSPTPQPPVRVTVSAVGDVMCHSPEYNAALKADGTYDFSEFFVPISDYLSAADFTLANLETTISTDERGYSGYPCFKTPESLLPALKDAGVDVLTTSNNHCFDAGWFGVTHTIEKMESYGFLHTGTFTTPTDQGTPLILEKDGVRIAVLAYTFGTNGMETIIDADRLDYAVTYTDDWEQIHADIVTAREQADVVIACVHWGGEYQREPVAEQQELAQKMMEAGVDAILGSHPHVLQPMKFKDVTTEEGEQKRAFVVYSLGNFLSNQRDRYKDSGMVLNLTFEKNFTTGATRIVDADYVPTYVHKYADANGKNHYQVLPVSGYLGKDLEGNAGERLTAVWSETTGHMDTENIKAR